MLHPIDQAILENKGPDVLRPLLHEHAKLPLPPQGASYWGDHMRQLSVLSGAGTTPEDIAEVAANKARTEIGEIQARIYGGPTVARR